MSTEYLSITREGDPRCSLLSAHPVTFNKPVDNSQFLFRLSMKTVLFWSSSASWPLGPY